MADFSIAPTPATAPTASTSLRPSNAEVERFGRLIQQHEHLPESSLPQCCDEAELLLWLTRSWDFGQNRDQRGTQRKRHRAIVPSRQRSV